MIESISYLGLAVALFLPWLFGSALILLINTRTDHWNWFSIAGQGYLAGILLTTLIIRIWNGVGFHLHFWAITSVLCVLIISLTLVALRLRIPPFRIPQLETTQNWQRGVILVLLAIIFTRYFTLLQEIIDKPMYAWDAWMNWSPKAITWFQHKDLTNYVNAADWLQLPAGEGDRTLGNFRASEYPPTVPLIQLWTMMGLNSHDSTLIYLPWLMAPISLGLALYGQLKSIGKSPVMATAAVYLLLNLPYANVHTALYGYADIWLAAAFAMAVFSLNSWQYSKNASTLTSFLFWALFCSQLKIPGIVLSIILALAFLRAALALDFKTELLIAPIFIVALISLACIGVTFEIPNLGILRLTTSYAEIPLIGLISFSFHDIKQAVGESLFLMLNWNFLWYILLTMLLVAIVRKRFVLPPSNTLFVIMLACLFLGFTFQFTGYYVAALNFTTLNRALLYLAPVTIYYLFSEYGDSGKTHDYPKRNTSRRESIQKQNNVR